MDLLGGLSDSLGGYFCLSCYLLLIRIFWNSVSVKVNS